MNKCYSRPPQIEENIYELALSFITYNISTILRFKMSEDSEKVLYNAIKIAIPKTQKIIENITFSAQQTLNLYNSQQNATFLYHVGRALLRANQDQRLIDCVFYLNKIINCIDIYPKVDLPGAFFLSHGVSCVLGDATYGNNIVFFQNVTIGRTGENRPRLGNNIVIYPGATISGSSVISDDCTIGAGCVIHNMEIPPNTVIANTPNGLKAYPNEHSRISEFFVSLEQK